MSAGYGGCVDLMRGGLAWPGVVVLWTGLWTLLDQHVPGGTAAWKELSLAVAGAWIMVWTRTLFSNAGMDSWDYEGSLAEMGSLLAQGKLRWRDEVKFYARSLLAFAGSILFWDGVYTLCDEHTREGTLTYNLACATLGGAGMVWVMTSEDDESDDDPEDGGGDGIDTPSVLPAALRSALGGRDSGGQLSRLPPATRGRLYMKALFCNVSSVVFWKGVEEIIEDNGPDEAWTGLVFFVVGISILVVTGRLSLNSGLDDGLPPATELQQQATRDGTGGFGATWSPSSSSHHGGVYSHPSFADTGIIDEGTWSGWPWGSSRSLGLGAGFGSWFREGGGRVPWRRRRRRVFPRWVTTAAELTGVVFAWTGIEWYVWDGDYISDTWLRDLMYIGAGLGILVCTGTFFNLAGTISPVAALKHVHQHNRHEETTPLLSSSDARLVQPETP
ncbi:unnamed protein product [Pylaiella littoralis]